MFKRQTINEQAMEDNRIIDAILSDLIKTKADMEYMAMMSDIELDEEEEEDAEE